MPTPHTHYPEFSEANLLVIRLDLQNARRCTEIVAAGPDLTCAKKLSFKIGRVVFWDCQPLSIGLHVTLNLSISA